MGNGERPQVCAGGCCQTEEFDTSIVRIRIPWGYGHVPQALKWAAGGNSCVE